MTRKGFLFNDKITEIKRNESLTAFFTLKGDEEFLLDHFADFPVMPGVLILQSLKQAADWLLNETRQDKSFYKIVSCEDIKFGQFVKPGSHLRIEARLAKVDENRCHVEGRIHLVDEPKLESLPRQRVLQAKLILEKAEF